MTYTEFVKSRVKWLETPQLNLVHSGMGLLGEAVEYLEAHMPAHRREELGDLEFYYEHAMQTVAKDYVVAGMQITREELNAIQSDPEYWILHYCAEYHDFAKKAFIYNKPLAELSFPSTLARIGLCLGFLARKNQTNRDDIQAENQAKLEARYPDGYSDSAAQTRADKLNGGSAFV